MRRVMEKGTWTSVLASNVPICTTCLAQSSKDLCGLHEAKAASGELKPSKTVQATDLWRKILTMLFETGHPWITFKDACNVARPQQHAGVVHRPTCARKSRSTPATQKQPCATWAREPGQHLKNGQIDHEKLKKTITAMRMLDNVIDINYYAVKKARDSNLRHRPGSGA